MTESCRIITREEYQEYLLKKEQVEDARKKIKILEEQLAEANEVIKFFAESKVGEKQEDGTYVVFTCGEKENGNVLGYKRYTYNPKPAVDYLKKWGVK